MVGILSDEAKEIIDYLKKQITPEDKKWLRERFPAWNNSLKSPDWDKKWASNLWDVHQRITEILDAKMGKARHHFFVDPLDKDDILELAKILNLKVSFKTKKRTIINLILETIRKCPHCKGDGNTGTASSTEGPQIIFCPECQGTGKRLRKQK